MYTGNRIENGEKINNGYMGTISLSLKWHVFAKEGRRGGGEERCNPFEP